MSLEVVAIVVIACLIASIAPRAGERLRSGEGAPGRPAGGKVRDAGIFLCSSDCADGLASVGVATREMRLDLDSPGPEFVRALNEMLPGANALKKRVWDLQDELWERLGRPPTAQEVVASFEGDPLLEPMLKPSHGVSGGAVFAPRVESTPIFSRADRTVERRLSLAALFLPAANRERYRREWQGEAAGMPSAAAAQFALNLLIRAPRSGLALRLRRIFGRAAT